MPTHTGYSSTPPPIQLPPCLLRMKKRSCGDVTPPDRITATGPVTSSTDTTRTRTARSSEGGGRIWIRWHGPLEDSPLVSSMTIVRVDLLKFWRLANRREARVPAFGPSTPKELSI